MVYAPRVPAAPDYSGQRTEPLGESDLDLFANLGRPEFSPPASELTRLVTKVTREVRVRAALESIRSNHRSRRIGVRIYRCPLHGESLVLQKKREGSADLFDEFFLGCPRWLPDNEGCNFVVKLKSAARISSVFDHELGEGLISVAG